MAMAIKLEIFNRILGSSGHSWTPSPPTSVAPNVLAIVFKLRIAELVSSMLERYLSSSFPLVGCDWLKRSISTGVVPRSMASNMEQMAETNIVNTKARKNNVIILWVGIKEIQRLVIV